MVWQSYTQDGSHWGVIGRRFNAAAAPLSGEFAISTVANGHQRYPRVSNVPDGRFAVVWDDEPRDNSRFGIFGRRYDAAGNPFGPEIQLNVYTTDHQREPDGGRLRGRELHRRPGSRQDQFGPAKPDVMARAVDAAGTPGAEIRVNQATALNLDQFLAAADADETGNIVLAWDSIHQDGSLDGVYARRFGGLLAAGLRVDTFPIGALSNGNLVFEPNETVVVQPSWRNVNGLTMAFDGAATAFTGPPGPAYAIVDAASGYGSVSTGDTRECGATGGCYVMRATGGRPTLHWDAQFRENIVPATVGQSKAWALHIGDTFADMPRTVGPYRFVETVLHRGVMGACSPTQFCPSAVVPRDQMAMFVLKSKDPYWVPTACVAGRRDVRRRARLEPVLPLGRGAGAARRGGGLRGRELLPALRGHPRAARRLPAADPGGDQLRAARVRRADVQRRPRQQPVLPLGRGAGPAGRGGRLRRRQRIAPRRKSRGTR